MSMRDKQGTPEYRVPSTISIGRNRYRCIRYGSDDGHRRVSVLYPFTVGGGHGGEYLIQERDTGEAPY